MVDDVLGHSKKPTVVQTRSLLCYWAVREVGMTTTDVAGKLGISQPAVRACCAGRAFCNREGVAIAVKGRNAELHGRPLFAAAGDVGDDLLWGVIAARF